MARLVECCVWGSTSETIWRQRRKPKFENFAAKNYSNKNGFTLSKSSTIWCREVSKRWNLLSVVKTRSCAYARWLTDSNDVFSNIELPVVRNLWLENGILVWQPAQRVCTRRSSNSRNWRAPGSRIISYATGATGHCCCAATCQVTLERRGDHWYLYNGFWFDCSVFKACPRVVTPTALQTAGAFVRAHDYRAVRTPNRCNLSSRVG